MEFSHLNISFAMLGFGVSAILNLLSYRLDSKPQIFRSAFVCFVLSTITLGMGLISLDWPQEVLKYPSALIVFAICLLAIFAHIKFKTKTITTFISPISTIILIIQSFTSQDIIAHQHILPYPQKFLSAHIFLSICGQSFAILASVLAITYLWQQRNLKKKLLSALSPNIPALDRIENLLVLSLWLGFTFITMGLISGAIYSVTWGRGTQELISHNFVKLTWAIIVWFWYLTITLSHTVFKFSTKKTAQMTLIGFILLLTTFFGIFAVSLGGM